MGLLSGSTKTVPFSAFSEGKAEEIFSIAGWEDVELE